MDARFSPRHQLHPQATKAIQAVQKAWLADQLGEAPPKSLSPEAIQQARNAGYWEDDHTLTHDEAIAQLCQLRDTAEPADLVRAFLLGIAHNRPDWWSALPAFAFSQHLAAHPRELGTLAKVCRFCGLPLWPEDQIPVTPNLDLALLLETGSQPSILSATAALKHYHRQAPFPPVEPAEQEPLLRVLDAARSAPPKTTATKLAKLLKGIAGSPHEQRLNLVEGLAVMGVLAPRSTDGERISYQHRFVAFEDTQVGHPRDDTHFPARLWSSEHGVDDAALQSWLSL